MTRPEAMTANIDENPLGYVALGCLKDMLYEPDQTGLAASETLFEQSAQVETIAPSAALTYKIITVVTPGSTELDRIELSKEDD